jgi:malate dehydrogenase (oxaloacetate-decarboxylating)
VFWEPVVRETARKAERPIIFPLSNPNDKIRSQAEHLIHWTDGRALVATGPPFPPVSYGGRKIPIAQCNNVYIFPTMGWGVAFAVGVEAQKNGFAPKISEDELRRRIA